jgi:hypothetical protein
MMYPCAIFELNVCNRSRDNKWKPMMMDWWKVDNTVHAPNQFITGA